MCTFIIVQHKLFMVWRADLMLCSCSIFKLQPHALLTSVIVRQYSIISNVDFIEKDAIRESDPRVDGFFPSKLAIKKNL